MPPDERSPVAIVVSVYNKAAFVTETLQSALAQTYRSVELVVVDDGSTDDSAVKIRDALAHTPARIVTIANGGVSNARNIGFGLTSVASEYVMFLDADDILLPNAIERLVEHLERHPDATACYCDLEFVGEDGTTPVEAPDQVRWERTRFRRRRIPPQDPRTPLDAVWSHFWALPSTTLIRRSAFEEIDGWDSSLCRPARPFHAEDKDLAIQLALAGQLHHVDERLVKYRVLPSGHKDAVYDGLRALDAKWAAAALPSAQRRRVRQALWFDARVHLLGAWCAVAHDPAGGRWLERVEAAVRASLRFASTGYRVRTAARRVKDAASTTRPSSSAAR